MLMRLMKMKHMHCCGDMADHQQIFKA